MSVSVKICGINSAVAADAVLHAGADFGGLVFFPQSPRAITLESGAALAARMRGRLKLAALVVDADDELLARIAEQIRPDFFQLHGGESPARAAEIRARFSRPLIKALPVAEAADLARAKDYDGIADMLMFDAKAPENASRPGGHGAAFDWRIMAQASLHSPWFLAGGLNSENISRAIAVSGATMVDVSSGVESAPGVKSENMIAAFVAAARQTVHA